MSYDDFFKQNYTPSTAFYFAVKFNNLPEMDSSFQEVSGLKVTLGTEERKEGGENNFVLHLPTPTSYQDLVLKRCLLNNSALNRWCKNALEDFKFDPKDIKLQLLGANGGSLVSWTIIQAYPISWELSSLNSTRDELAIETLTLKFRSFKRD
ncbi:phage tail protein [uncultured Maribacter sp.]|uniref:phage tail protein n=1 Tax=uncultured Maribacter sp. TaxID=431308 RepID=UPI0030D8BFE2|tara:strand:- start:1797 stop:2252 length:456 start_codon:yes stop_codon:yes gene_type:complete